MIATHPSKTLKETPAENSSCFACKLLDVAGRRVYFQNDDFLIVENFNAMTPILVAKEHGVSKIPFGAFDKLKDICSKLFNDAYCLAPSQTKTDHYYIKVIKLNSVTLPVF